ncbi:MAG: methyltransferase domain-containing protein [Alphaproteobacteria bacterium]
MSNLLNSVNALVTLRAWLRDSHQFSVPKLQRECPICGYKGIFVALGRPSRWDGRCPACRSNERDRLIWLFLQQRKIDLKDGRDILHFAPEAHFLKLLGSSPNYHTADITPGRARHLVDITAIQFPDESFDLVICNHVLEHVERDHIALKELFRVLRKGGFALITVPQNWSRETTYENPRIGDNLAMRYAHYSHLDHVRYYGRDFEKRMAAAGFRVECWRMPEEDEPRYGLSRDEVLWLGWKT